MLPERPAGCLRSVGSGLPDPARRRVRAAAVLRCCAPRAGACRQGRERARALPPPPEGHRPPVWPQVSQGHSKHRGRIARPHTPPACGPPPPSAKAPAPPQLRQVLPTYLPVGVHDLCKSWLRCFGSALCAACVVLRSRPGRTARRPRDAGGASDNRRSASSGRTHHAHRRTVSLVGARNHAHQVPPRNMVPRK